MKPPFGLSAALALPVRADGTVDLDGMARHALRCLDAGCGSVTVFGTTGEGASLGISTREQMLGALASAGLDMRVQVVGGVSASAVEDAVVQARMVLDRDCRAVLLAPPFYFKGVGDDGLFDWFAQVFDGLGPQARDVILYNIPGVTAVPLSLGLIGRLRGAYPDVIAGIKDSSGDFDNARALLADHSDLAILIGDERRLGAAMKLGAQGSISGLANVCAGDLSDIIHDGADNDRIPKLVDTVLKFPVVPAVKALIARQTSDPGWLRVRPPLVSLDADQVAEINAAADAMLDRHDG